MTEAVLVSGAIPLAVSQEFWDNKGGRAHPCFFWSQIPFEELSCLVESQKRRWVGIGSTQGLPPKQELELGPEQNSTQLCFSASFRGWS